MVQSKIETFTAMLAEQPENAMIWYGLASEQYKLENWAEAAKSLRQVVSLNPDYTAAYKMLGTILAKMDDLAGAQQAWKGARFASTQRCCFNPPAARTRCALCSKLNKNAAPIFSGSP